MNEHIKAKIALEINASGDQNARTLGGCLDVNALSYGKSSVLADHLLDPIPERLVPTINKFIANGLDPAVNGGLHIVRALKTLAWNPCGFEVLEAFKMLLKLLDNETLERCHDDETLSESIDKSIADSEEMGGYEWLAQTGILSTILDARLTGEPADEIFGWDRAIGKTIDDIFCCYPRDQKKTPATYLVMKLGNEALVLHCSMVLHCRSDFGAIRLPIDVSKSARKLFPELIGRRIVGIDVDGPGICEDYPGCFIVKLNDGTFLTFQASREHEAVKENDMPSIKMAILRLTEADLSEIETDKLLDPEDYNCAQMRVVLF